jgi:hypothetical protein
MYDAYIYLHTLPILRLHKGKSIPDNINMAAIYTPIGQVTQRLA